MPTSWEANRGKNRSAVVAVNANIACSETKRLKVGETNDSKAKVYLHGDGARVRGESKILEYFGKC